MAAGHATPGVIRGVRCLRLALHLARIGLGAALIYPFVANTARQRLKQRWSRGILETLSIRIEAEQISAPAGCLIVANHVSWLDIFAINSVRPAAFIAKSEVRRWPFIGWMSARNDTIFLLRGSRGHAAEINKEIDTRLTHGQDVAFFPEGMTTDGQQLRPFHGALFQPAIESDAPILPLAVSYHDSNGERSLAPAYAGSTSLLQCFCTILASRTLTIRIRAAHPIAVLGKTRRELADLARNEIATRLNYQERTSSGEHGT